MPETILIAEDDPVQRKILTMLLQNRFGYHVITTENGQELMETVKAAPVDAFSAVILDVAMPVMDGFETLRALRKYRANIPVLMLTGKSDASLVVKAMKEGAFDFIIKPANPTHLEVTLKNAIRMHAMMQELSRLKRDKEGTLTFLDLIGHDKGLAQMVVYGRKASSSDIPVLITGQTGVGKELFARAIHGESKVSGAPFVAVNCGAIPENLAESILFGHEKGAFTGATSRTIGKFREAEGGTIFLDEVGELSPDAQVKLLRVLQQKEIEPVGSSKAAKINVRIISATNKDLKALVKQGVFREDLYFRLNVLHIHVPSLHDRGEDVLALAEHFIQRFSLADMIFPKTLSADAKDYLLHYDWPGNVRELENLIRRAMVLTDADAIDRAQLERLHDITASAGSGADTGGLAIALRMPDGTFKTMEQIESEVMQMVLHHHKENITRAAETLGIAKSTFYRKIKDAQQPDQQEG